jgi:hypothetical protein
MSTASTRLRILVPLAALSLLVVGVMLMPAALAAEKGDDPKEALQELQEFIGGWKGAVDKGGQSWKENTNWSWRFANKGKDVTMTVEMPEGKLYKSGEMRFISDKGKYQFTLVDKAGKKAVFLGNMKKSTLILERVVPETKDVEQIKMNTAAGGVRLVYTFSHKPADRTLYTKDFTMSYTKEGEGFGVAAGQKGPECVVTGGLGTMQVSYMGQTYYVCCTGCRDAFNENPAKIIAEYKARKAAGK